MRMAKVLAMSLLFACAVAVFGQMYNTTTQQIDSFGEVTEIFA